MHAWKQHRPIATTYPEGAEFIEQAVQFDHMLEEEGRLQQAMASFFLAAKNTPRGVCLLEHGITAGPFQYWELAERLSQEGYHVYAPRLPGHGLALADGTPDPSDLPKSHEYWRYQAAAKAHFQALEPLLLQQKLPLYVVGFSAGGVMALWMLSQFKDHVQKLILVAPYFAPKAHLDHFMLSIAQSLNIGGRIGKFLDSKPFRWSDADRPKALAWGRPGHFDFFMGNLFAVDKAKREVLKELKKQHTVMKPLLLIITEGDGHINSKCAYHFYQQQHGERLLKFAANRKIPHAMLSPMENPDDKSRQEVQRTILHFLQP